MSALGGQPLQADQGRNVPSAQPQSDHKTR